MPSKTKAPRDNFFTGPGTVTEHAVVAAVPTGGYSLHDCVDVGQCSLQNCIWPVGAASGPITFKYGLTVYTRIDPGSATIKVSIA